MPEVTIYANLEGVDEVTEGFRQMGEAVENMGSQMGDVTSDISSYSTETVTNYEWMSNAATEMADKTTKKFREVGDTSENMGKEIKHMGRELVMLGVGTRAVGELGERFGFLNKQQADVINTMGSLMTLSGSVVRALSLLADAEWALELATKARAAATFIANEVSGGISAVVSGIVSALKAIADSEVAVTIAANARALATAVANAVESYGAAVPIMIAAAALAVAGITAYLATVPSRQYGGPIHETGTYLLHAGEYVLPRGASSTSIQINVYGVTSPRETGDAVVDALRRARVV